ncbi:MAG: hypothetical protein JSS82_02290 [Bacteroidetes bacterium]|nr:hypothetical protein [Bacteroidota bacterium]
MDNHTFKGRDLVIATMHNKEAVMAPILEAELGVTIVEVNGFNTDCFGTFTGEVERNPNPVEAARMKCRAAMKRYGCSLAVASEGSFGSHPTVPFLPADDEIILLIDMEYGLEIKVRELTTDTNFKAGRLHTWEEVKNFAEEVCFPSHSLILRRDKDDISNMVKGINSWNNLKTLVDILLGKYGGVFLETDMRALHNPTRMNVIKNATKRLIESINKKCPACTAPGFDVVDVREGLPCEACGMPTRSTLAYICGCQKCGARRESLYPHSKTQESPMYCDWCNP